MRTVTLPDGNTRTRLETWGEIASHLGVEIRTAQRWERRMGIPIRRLDGGQAVFAFADELDAWLDKKQVAPVISPEQELPPGPSSVALAAPPQPEPVPRGIEAPALPLSRAWLWVAGVAVVGGLLLVAATVLLTRSPVRSPARLILDGPTLFALDFADVVLWRHDFPNATKPIDSVSRPDLVSWWERMDVDGDGVDEITAVVRHPQFDGDLNETLYVFAFDGQLKYSYVPDQKMVFSERSFSGPYMFWDIEPVPEDKSIWVSLVHAPWWASGVVRIDSNGAASLRFAQPGLVRTVKARRSVEGLTVLAGGVNNQFGAATLAVLDVGGPPATAPQEGADSYSCLNCPVGLPLAYMLFLPSPLSIAEGRPYNEVFSVRVSSEALELTTWEAELARIVYRLTTDLAPVSATPSDGYWTWKPRFDSNWRGRDGHTSTIPVRRWVSGEWSDHSVALAGTPVGTPTSSSP